MVVEMIPKKKIFQREFFGLETRGSAFRTYYRVGENAEKKSAIVWR